MAECEGSYSSVKLVIVPILLSQSILHFAVDRLIN